MGLADRYKALAAGGTVGGSTASSAPSTPAPATVTTAAPSVASGSSSPADASAPTTTHTPATQTRDLGALRARLAGGLAGGVNPPEGAAKMTEALTEPRTVETPDGGAAPAPGFVETKAGTVVRAPTPADAPSAAAAAAPAGELTRGQKAAATRAANKAAKAAAPAATSPEPAPCTSAGDDSPSVAFSLKDIHTDDLLAEIYKRVAARFI